MANAPSVARRGRVRFISNVVLSSLVFAMEVLWGYDGLESVLDGVLRILHLRYLSCAHECRVGLVFMSLMA